MPEILSVLKYVRKSRPYFESDFVLVSGFFRRRLISSYTCCICGSTRVHSNNYAFGISSTYVRTYVPDPMSVVGFEETN